MTVAVEPFVRARCDINAHFSLDSQIGPWVVDHVLISIAKRALHQVFPMMVEIERTIAAAPPEEEWRLVGQLLDACPLGLKIETVSRVDGFDLQAEQDHVSRHDLLALHDALEHALKAEVQQPTALQHALTIELDLLEVPADQTDAT